MRPTPIAGTLVLGLALLAACDQQTNPTAVYAGPLFATAPADDNGSKVVIPVDFTFPVSCGDQTITGHADGWVQIRLFDGPDSRNVEVLVVNILFTMTNSAGATFVWREVGIDHFTIAHGVELRAIIGRGGEFGVIGRIVINQTTGEVVFVAGNNVGNAFENACAALT